MTIHSFPRAATPTQMLGRFLKMKDCQEITGLSENSVRAAMRQEHDPFPQPISDAIGNGGTTTRWIEAEVVMWQARRIDAARGPGAAQSIIRELQELTSPAPEQQIPH